MKHSGRFLAFLLLFLVGCSNGYNLTKEDPKQHLLDNLSTDLAEINLIAENARREFQTESFDFRILDAWSLAKETKIQKLSMSQAKVITVIQTSIIEIRTSNPPLVVEVLKVQGEEQRSFGVARPNKVGVFYREGTLLAEAGGYPIRLYDSTLELDPKAVEAIRQYVRLTARVEKTAKIIFNKMLELQEKYRDSKVSIESFRIHLPSISLDLQFKIKE
jgi:hypothetical protein